MITKNYKFIIQYDGSNLHGWQIQKEKRTVQGDIERALSLIYPREKITLIGSGRTDAGVHALGQSANIKLPSKLSAFELRNALNGNLKKDIFIDYIEEVGDNFHARFSATKREYEYRLIKNFSTITRNYTTPLKWEINCKLLNECTDLLIGKHDFTSFCKANSEVKTKVCIVYSAIWEELEEMLIFRIKANRFLQHMVRYLVGTILEVARSRYSLKTFNNLLNNLESKAMVVRAPACGLFLKRVSYD